jgi:hypothetical protein
MEAFSPEFAQDWIAGQSAAPGKRTDGDGPGSAPLSPAQQEALEELADRITAARSVY